MKIVLYNPPTGKETVMSEVETISDITGVINNYCEENNFKSYYLRTWEHDGNLFIDYGSYVNYFVVKPCTFDKWISMNNDEFAEENYD